MSWSRNSSLPSLTTYSRLELKLIKHIKIVIEYYLIHLDIPVSGTSGVVVRMVSVDPVAVTVIGGVVGVVEVVRVVRFVGQIGQGVQVGWGGQEGGGGQLMGAGVVVVVVGSRQRPQESLHE